MYRDDSKTSSDQGQPVISPKQHAHVEKKLSGLEQAASVVFKKIIATHSNSEVDVELSTSEHATLLKFVFIMKCRSTNFFERFNYQYSADYKDNDKATLIAYMRDKGHVRPIDVWFEMIVKIVDLDMDGDDEWDTKLQELIYPELADWAWIIMRKMYPVICTPSNSQQEFVLSEHAYSLFEGPVTSGAWVEFHTMCILAPRVALLMRSDVLPEDMEDKDIHVKAKRQEALAQCTRPFPKPDQARSKLHDLPVSRPRIIHGKDRDVKTAVNQEFSTDMKLSFSVFVLAQDDIDSINSVILEEASDLSLIVFKSKEGLKLALEAYLSRPIRLGMFSMKRVLSDDDDPKLIYLKQLEKVAEQLGSTIKAVYKKEAVDLAIKG